MRLSIDLPPADPLPVASAVTVNDLAWAYRSSTFLRKSAAVSWRTRATSRAIMGSILGRFGFKKVLPRRQVGAIGAGSKFSLETQQAPCQSKRPVSDAESRSAKAECQLYLAVLGVFS